MISAPSRRSSRTRVLAIAAALAPAIARAAPPDTPTRAQLATARDLFIQAERNEDAGRWQDALDTLRQVALVKLTAGVRYHIALCEEHLGMLANALDDFAAAKEQAVIERAQDVLRLVDGEIESLSPRVPRLAIHLTPGGPDAEVTLDGESLEVARLDESRPVNPGVHRIEARAAGRRPASVVVTMHERDATSLEIPLSAPEPPLPPPAPSPAPATQSSSPHRVPSGWSTARVEAVTATASAAVLVGGGVAAYVAAGATHDDAVRSCEVIISASASACDSKKNAVRALDWIAASTWAGASVSAGLAIWLWTRPARPGSSASLQWVVGAGFVGARGRF
jgi:hypothetical protein